MSPLRAQSQRRLGETRGGRVPKKMEIWGDVFYGWSLSKICQLSKRQDISRIVFNSEDKTKAILFFKKAI